MKVGTPEYIGAMAFQLAKIARANKLHTLSNLLELASLEAARICENTGERTSVDKARRDQSGQKHSRSLSDAKRTKSRGNGSVAEQTA